MKIKLANLMPNPYRNMDEYPIDREKVESLKNSIKETSFWDNILCRPSPTESDVFQLAFGHHRLIALRELRIKTIDIPVRNIPDDKMILIMAEENNSCLQSPQVIIQTVAAVRKFLRKKLPKDTTWEKCKKHISLRRLFEGHKDKKTGKVKNPKAVFGNVIAKGIGINTIHRFLGKNWGKEGIAKALGVLEALKDNKLDKQAVNSLSTMCQAKQFRLAVEKVTKVIGKTPKPKAQRKVAKRYADRKIKDSELYGDLVTAQYPGHTSRILPCVDFENYIDETSSALDSLTRKIQNISNVLEEHPNEPLPDSSLSLFSSIAVMGITLKEFAAKLKKRTKPVKKQKLLMASKTKSKTVKSKVK